MNTLDQQAAIMEKLTELADPKFRTVEAYPLARLYDNAFTNDLQKLKLPAALLVLQADSQDGNNVRRNVHWLVIVIFGGTQKGSTEMCIKAIDAIRAEILNQALDGRTHLRPDSRMEMMESGAQFAAAAITLKTVGGPS